MTQLVNQIIKILANFVYSIKQYNTMEKQKNKQNSNLENLHPFQSQIFLGFASNQSTIITEYESSFVCGKPLWLKTPNQKLFKCNQCHNQNLTFLCQIFCPLNANHCYNRILYIIFCQKCRRCFKCLKQQTTSQWQPSQQLLNLKCGVKIIQQKAYQIQSQSYQKKELLKILNRSKLQVEEQAIIQQAFDEDEQDEDQVEGQKKQFTDLQLQKINEQNFKNNKFVQNIQKQKHQEYQKLQKEVQNMNINQKVKSDKLQTQQQKEKTDLVFEQYKKSIKTLNNPIMLYSNVPISYNSFPLNPKHFCKWCESKMELEVQLTQQFLLINKNLVTLDWGSLMIYTCAASCQKSEEECVVVQYQADAISEQQVKKLKKKKKNKKKNKSKSKSNQKQKQEKSQTNLQKIQLKGQKISESKQQNQQGDWD